MNDMRNQTEDILTSRLPGYHRLQLLPKAALLDAGNGLCGLLGCSRDALMAPGGDGYTAFVHPADRERYDEFLLKAAASEQPVFCDYRLVKCDGSSVYVRDTLMPHRLADGTLAADSLLTDITDLKQSDLAQLNEKIPFGYMHYTCEKQPRILSINQQMVDMLRFPKAAEGEMDYLEMYKSNIFLMVPMEERRRFSKYLDRVYAAESPIAGDMTMLRCDGTRAHVFGMVVKCADEQGQEQFLSICVDVTERYRAQKSAEKKRYIKALADVYDKIFEYNLDANTVKCLHCGPHSYFKLFENVAMQIDDALEKWLVDSVSEENREEVRRFFMDFCQKRLHSVDGKPPKITYSARSSDGSIRQYMGLFIKVDEAVSYYCCREVKDAQADLALQLENTQLKEKMRDLVMQFSDGLAAFEVTPQYEVKPLYASENISEYFGYTREEWLPLTERYTPLESFVAYSEANMEDFETLLTVGEKEFTYFDYKTESEKKIRAICSEKEHNPNASRYVMLYDVEESETEKKQTLPENRTVSIRTFGYFDVFVGDVPIAFRNKKSKELFALLVDRKGGYITSEEAISYLWEDEPANTLTLARYRKVALRLKSTLEEYGISDIVESKDGMRRIVMDKVECDLYQYLTGKEEYRQLFKGSYLSNYSWADITLSELNNHRGE
ncbi:MAG: PAS domain-containing protein [Clostridia bacterium]|nr:PAS domain-containing protein [Clostridia bacterium]